nr:reverse transcriptase domain-containing protein [Kitasatospora aureofaciens]
MSPGSYFPPPVRAVAIPNPHGGGARILGIPAVSDRVAQTVVARHLMRRVDPIFHPDSFGYRPGRSALDAVGKCRERYWKRDWVVELNIAKFLIVWRWPMGAAARARGSGQRSGVQRAAGPGHSPGSAATTTTAPDTLRYWLREYSTGRCRRAA